MPGAIRSGRQGVGRGGAPNAPPPENAIAVSPEVSSHGLALAAGVQCSRSLGGRQPGRRRRRGIPAQLVGRAFHVPPVGRDVPRYIFHVTGHSELIERLGELDREHRLS